MKSSKKLILLSSAYELFINKGLKKTTIQNIVDKANLGKGTFYLYFKNKEDLENQLLIDKTNELFINAFEKIRK